MGVERVLDLGCGTGGSTVVLAQDTGAHVTAVDIHPPFLAALRARARELGLANRITTVAADMANAASLGTGFDLVWAEGSAYSIGFENALRSWRPLLRPGGCLVVTELVWFRAEPAARARGFFADEYPDMCDEATRIHQARDVGYELIGSFRLPAEDWHAYYAGLEAPLQDAISRHGDRELYAALQLEREIYEVCADDHGLQGPRILAWRANSEYNLLQDGRFRCHGRAALEAPATKRAGPLRSARSADGNQAFGCGLGRDGYLCMALQIKADPACRPEAAQQADAADRRSAGR